MHHYFIGDELPHHAHLGRDIPGWMQEQIWLRSGRRTIMLALSILAFIAVAAAGPDVMFSETVTGATMVRWPWLVVWTTVVVGGIWEWRAVLLCRRWRRASRELRFESLSRAIDFARDTLTLSEQGRSDYLWRQQAVMPLAALVYTASAQGNGEGMPWVRRMVAHLGEDGAAGWRALAAAVSDADGRLQARVGRWADSEPRQRDSVALVLQEAVGVYAGARA